MNARNFEGMSVLVVDDDDVFRGRLARALSARGLEVRQASTVDEATALAHTESPELAVVDLKMPGGSGLDLVRTLLRLDPHTRVVVLTGYGSVATAVEAMRFGAVHYLAKPADADEVLAAFQRPKAGGPDAGEDENGTPTAKASVPSLARVEWEHIQRVMTDCGDNVTQAARLLGLHRRSLQRKLSKYPVAR